MPKKASDSKGSSNSQPRKGRSSRARRAKARKAQILEAAQQVFAQNGYHEATISDVARTAGISDATVYEYFSSKEEILFTIPVEPTHRVIETLESQLKYVRGASNKIRSCVYHFLSFYQDHPDYAWVVLVTLRENRKFFDTETFQKIRSGQQVIVDILEEGIASGELRPEIDSDLARVTLNGAIDYLVFRWLVRGQTWDLLEQVDPLTDLLIGGLGTGRSFEGWDVQITLEPPKSPGNESPGVGKERSRKRDSRAT